MSRSYEVINNLLSSDVKGIIRRQELLFDTNLNLTNPIIEGYSTDLDINSPLTGRIGFLSFIYQNTFYIFGGFSNGNYFSDFWKLDILSGNWKQLNLLNSPSARAFSSISSNNNLFYIHGGRNEETQFNDLFVFNASNESWNEILTTNRPPIIDKHSTIFNNNFLYRFGGEIIIQFFIWTILFSSAEVWRLNLNTNQWMRLTNLPETRKNMISQKIGNEIFLFYGNQSVLSSLNSIIRTSILQNDDLSGYEIVNVIGNEHNGRVFISSTVSQSKIYLYGGKIDTRQNTIPINELSIFDTTTSIFTKISPFSPNILRTGSSLFNFNGNIYLFGGQNQIEDLNDLWIISPEIKKILTKNPKIIFVDKNFFDLRGIKISVRNIDDKTFISFYTESYKVTIKLISLVIKNN